MARNVQWRRTVSDTTSWRQDQALNSTAFIVKEVGPTGFLLKFEDENKPVKVMLGDPHSCTCLTFFRESNELCKHICWILLKKFRVEREDATSWQLGLVEREIDGLLSNEQRRLQEIRNRPESPRKVTSISKNTDGRPILQPRDIAEDDSCPICMEDLLAKKEPVTYCKYSCSNSIHIKCMKVWADHQTKAGEKTVKCPFCREDFGPLEQLMEEYRNATAGVGLRRPKQASHPRTRCQLCNQLPIQGKCYKCTSCNEFYFCQKCFNTENHTEHSFEYRAIPKARWRPAQRVTTNGLAVPVAMVNNLATREIGDGDYDLLLQLDNDAGAELSEIPESVIKKLPLERVRLSSKLLAPGEQCCICLRSYSPGDFFRRLPCKHKFHRACVDDWLLHQHPTCPLDGQVVWNGTSGQDEAPATRTRTRPARRQPTLQQPTVDEHANVDLEVPGISFGRRETQSANADVSRNSVNRRIDRASSNLSEPAPIFNNRSDNTVSLAQLLLTDAISTNSTPQTSETEQHRYLMSQISNTQPPDSNASISPLAAVQSRQQGSTTLNTTQVSINRNMIGQSRNTSSESANDNERRRNRNLVLAARAKKNQKKEANSIPSINTAQPNGASNLFLGNPALSSQRISEQPMQRLRAAPRAPSTKHRPQMQLAGGGQLSVGEVRNTAGIAESHTGSRRRGVPTRIRPSPSTQVTSQIGLELTGMALDNC